MSVQRMEVVGEDGGQMVKGLSGQAEELGFRLTGSKVPLKDFHCRIMRSDQHFRKTPLVAA